MEVRDQLLRVCALLNGHGAHYLIVGGHAWPTVLPAVVKWQGPSMLCA